MSIHCRLCGFTGGVDRFEYFRNVVAVPDARKTTLAWSFAAFGNPDLWVALITMLYLDFLDATGTLFSMGECGWGGGVRPVLRG
jgi:AGZA family xanthine/uracil permease-like MFS transporter